MRTRAVCIKIRQLEADIKRLRKKFPSVEADVFFVQRLLEAGKTLPQTHKYPGFGNHEVFKTRVINTSLGNKGKSGGYRLIYEEVNSEPNNAIILVMLYGKNEYCNENKVKNEIGARLSNPDYPTFKR